MFKLNINALFIPIIVLVFSIGVSIYTAIYVHQENKKTIYKELELKANDIKFNIQSRLNIYLHFSKSSSSYFMASDTITRNEWKNFVENSRISHSLEGFQGVSFIKKVSKSQLKHHTQRFKREFSEDYKVFPESEADIYTPIVFIEPLKDRNLKAVGFNISSNKVMKQSLQEATETNEATLTNKVTLIQEGEGKSQPGIVIYSPIYKKNSAIKTVEERKSAIIGWTAISFRMYDFMNGLMGQIDSKTFKDLSLKVYDGANAEDKNVLFNYESIVFKKSTTHQFKTLQIPIQLNTKTWNLNFIYHDLSFLESSGLLVLVIGILISFLISFLIYSLKNTAFLANSMAEKLTLNLSEKNEELISKNKLLKETTVNLEIAKEKAEESEQQLKLIANNFVNGMIYQVASLDNKKRKFNYVSDTVKKFYGCTANEVLENPDLIYSKIHPDDIEKVVLEEKHAIENLSIFNIEVRVINPDGKIRWSYITSQPRIINGIVCYDGMEIDITERKKMELELLDAKEKAEESDRLKSAFLANMSHEIRTPMNSILGFTDLLVNNQLSDEKKEQYHEIVHKSSKRLMNIISDIIDISKIEANQLNLNYTVFNLNQLLDNLCKQFEISPKRKNVTLSAEKPLISEESFMYSDEMRLTQVISNLLENALKFTSEGSIKFGYKVTESELQFYVKDTGLGIINKDHQLIFERFSQSENNKTVKEGTGLGLSISKGIIEALAGKIWVESEPNKGSNFYFTIPNCFIKKPIQIQEEKEITKFENKEIKTILIAEDEESNYLYIEAILENKNFKILHAVNGKIALDLFLKNKVDLILMDFNMPVMNGLEATKLIRKINLNVPIIALTAYVMAEDKKNALDVGCNDFLSKPLDKNRLLETIHAYLDE